MKTILLLIACFLVSGCGTSPDAVERRDHIKFWFETIGSNDIPTPETDARILYLEALCWNGSATDGEREELLKKWSKRAITQQPNRREWFPL